MGYVFPGSKDFNVHLGLGLVFSNANESLKPFLPGFYYDDFIGETIKRSNMRASGGEIFMNFWLFRSSRFSALIGTRLSIVRIQDISPNPLVDALNIRYIPGIGEDFNSNNLNSGQTGFTTMGFSLKLAYKVFSVKAK